MNPEPTNEFGNHPFSAAAMDDADYTRILDAACGYNSLGMYVEAEAELAHLEVPMRWRDRFESVQCRVAYAAGDMVKVIKFGFERCRRETPQPPNNYIMVAIALHSAGHWREAVAMNLLKIRRCGASANDYYGIACYYGRAMKLEASLFNLVMGLSDYTYHLKALVDSDLQPFWTRLASLKHSPHVLATLRDPLLRTLSRMRLTKTTKFTWDAPDVQALPSAFARWLITPPGSLDRMLSDAAPLVVKQHFQQWTLDRARANQKILRRALQDVRLPREYPWNDPKYAKYSTKKADRHSFSERAYHIAYDQLCKLRDEATDPALRQEYHEELLDMSHTAVIAAMLDDDSDDPSHRLT